MRENKGCKYKQMVEAVEIGGDDYKRGCCLDLERVLKQYGAQGSLKQLDLLKEYSSICYRTGDKCSLHKQMNNQAN